MTTETRLSYKTIERLRPEEPKVQVGQSPTSKRIGKDGKSYPSTRKSANKPKADHEPAPIAEPSVAVKPPTPEAPEATPNQPAKPAASRPFPAPVLANGSKIVPPAPEPEPEAPPEKEAEPDLDELLDAERDRLRAFFQSWPKQYRGMFVFMLKSLVEELTPKCPNYVDRSGEVFV